MVIERFRARPHSRAGRERAARGALVVVAALVVGAPGALAGTTIDRPGPGASPNFGPPVAQPPSPKPSRKQTETESVLNETQLGREALRWVRHHGVRVVYRVGGGSYYDGDAGLFYIDTRQSPEERANAFVHEVNHAEHHDGADIDDLSREDYIDRSIDEETEGTVEAIRNNQQLQKSRGGDAPDTLLQQEYEDAYERAVDRAKAALAEAALAQARRLPLDAAGEEAGRERVKRAFLNGEVVSSVDGDNYADSYGKAWDDAHDCFLWIFC
jgi:hypothetical protein